MKAIFDMNNKENARQNRYTLQGQRDLFTL